MTRKQIFAKFGKERIDSERKSEEKENENSQDGEKHPPDRKAVQHPGQSQRHQDGSRHRPAEFKPGDRSGSSPEVRHRQGVAGAAQNGVIDVQQANNAEHEEEEEVCSENGFLVLQRRKEHRSAKIAGSLILR